MAKEYIERDALLRDIEDAVVFSVGRNEPSAELRGAGKIVDRIRCAPTADVVEVVRCKDCKHWNKDAMACDTLPWVNSSEHANWYADDFCSYGERRDDNAQTD